LRPRIADLERDIAAATAARSGGAANDPLAMDAERYRFLRAYNKVRLPNG
jgi:regulator of protease activity HflC (stomatin/prohibitin superfamily)